MAQHVITATDKTFDELVIKGSARVPILVDFWAPWCGPCRMLTPTLEALAAEGNGTWLLAKVNTDENQALAAKYQIRGIPNVKAFRNGKVVDEFVGALPRPQVRAFIQKLLPAVVDDRLQRALNLAEAGKAAEAKAALQQLLREKPDDASARLALAAVLVDMREGNAAIKALEPLGERGEHGDKVRRLKALARFATGEGPAVRSPDGAAVAASDAMAVGYSSALALAKKGDWEAAADALLALLAFDRDYAGGAVKEDLLAIFEILGPQNPTTVALRKRMGTLLFA